MKNFIPRIYLSVFFIILAYVIFKSEVIAQGLRREYYQIHYIILFSFLIFSFGSFFFSKNLNYKIFSILTSFVFTLYLIEIFLIFNSSSIKRENLFKKYSAEYSQNNPEIVPDMIPHIHLKNQKAKIIPLAGFSKKKTIFCKEEYTSKYFSDRFGFRNSDEIWDNNNIDTLIIGDSFAHGACVNQSKTISGVFTSKKMINLNLAYSGTGPLIQYATLKEYLPLIKTKNIVWIYYEENDIQDLLIEKTNLILINYLKNSKFSQNLKDKQKIIDKLLLSKLKDEIKNKKNKKNIKDLKQFLKLNKVRFLLINIFKPTHEFYDVPKDFKKIFENVKQISDKNNIKVFFVYMPQKRRYLNNQADLDNKNYNDVINQINSLNIEVINLDLELMRVIDDPLDLYSKIGFHLNEFGYAEVSKLILNKIKQSSL
tara:strand:- start:156 stop:1433 length:1278 start_codon:yes stop_codon:yes gene_type:complete